MHYDFLGPTGLQGTHMDTLKLKNSKSIIFTVRGCFFTFLAILAHSAPRRTGLKLHVLQTFGIKYVSLNHNHETV